jgi:hypothetical protein
VGMSFAGIDYSSTAIDVVRLELDSDEARHDRILFDSTGKLDALERARRVRELMPPRSAWADDGVVTIAIEDALGQFFKGSIPLARVQGAVLACLPPAGSDPPVLALKTAEWKMACGLSGNAKKAEVRSFAEGHWTSGDPFLFRGFILTQDMADAFCIAWAARSICERAATAA